MVLNDKDTSFEDEIRKAESADLTAVEGRNVVNLVRDEDGDLIVDSDGNYMVILIPALVPPEENAWELAFKLFLRETKELAEQPYRVVYIHSSFSPPVWFAWWLVGLRSRVSRGHRKNLKALTVVHPSLMVRLLFVGLRPMLGANFWDKLTYADRIAELWLDDILSESDARDCIPPIVFTYEEKIVEEAEAMREAAIVMGAPLMPRENPANVNGQ